MKRVLLLFILIFSFLIGCSDKEVSKIEDNVTRSDLVNVQSDKYFIFNHLYDNMDRGNHEYQGEIVVNTNAFNDSKPVRGEIIYYKTPEFTYKQNKNLNPSKFEISRIIGLPGEEIEIIKGQIFINDALLDSFYGSEYKTGKLVKDSKVNLKETMILDNHYFVLGDNWWRSIDSLIFGSLNADQIQGRVLGMKK